MNNSQSNITLNNVDKTNQPLRSAIGDTNNLTVQLKETQDKLIQLNNLQKKVDGFIEIRKQLEETQKATQNLAIQFKQNEHPSQKLQQDFILAREETKKLKDNLNPLRSELQKSGIDTKDLSKQQSLLKDRINSTNKDIKQQSDHLTSLKTKQDKLNQVKASYDSDMLRINALNKFGHSSLSKGKMAAQNLQKVLNPGYEFDKNMSQTQAVLGIDDKNSAQILALKEQAKALSLSSTFTSSEVAQGQYSLGQKGFDSKQIIDAMPNVINLAVANGLNIETAVNKMFEASDTKKTMNGSQIQTNDEVARIAQIKMDNLNGDITLLRSAFQNISVELFAQNDQWLRKSVQGLTQFLQSINQFLQKHPALSKTLVMLSGGFTVATTALGGLSILLAQVLTPIIMARSALSTLGLSLSSSGTGIPILGTAFQGLGTIFTTVGRAFLLNPIGLVITGIIFAALLIRKYWEPISAFFIDFWEGLSTAIEPVIQTFSFMAPVFNAIGDALSAVINWFSDLLAPVQLTSEEFEGAKSAGVSFGTTIGNIIMAPIKLFEQLFNLVTSVWDLILSLPEKIADLPSKIGAIFTGENGLFSIFTNLGTNIVDGLVGGIKNKWNELKSTISELTDGVTGWFKEALGIHSPSRVFAGYGMNTIEGYKLGLENNQSDAIRSLSDFTNKIHDSGSYLNSDMIIDQRRAIPSSSKILSSNPSQYYITINAAPGMNEQELANKITQELERREWQQGSRFRNSLRDID